MADYEEPDLIDNGRSGKGVYFYPLAGFVRDNSHLIGRPFEWSCNARHPEVFMFSSKKHCRYCKPTEMPEDDHPLFWRGGRPIYNEDESWK